MPTVRVELGDRSYSILIEPGLMSQLGSLVRKAVPRAEKALLISDSEVTQLYGTQARTALEQVNLTVTKVTVPAGEASKSLAQAYSLYSHCANADLERSSVVVALGGGVVGDLAGFVAATYLRGIPWIMVPTTLLAQVDSSVGGKTGVDLPQGKNLVGSIHQPAAVVTDLNVLSSLPEREIAAGVAEVVKHAIIRDPGFLRYMESSVEAIRSLDPGVMGLVVETNCRIKAEIVAADEHEHDLRRILNFGHTVGHALEVAAGYGQLRHGECVSVGMVAAMRLAKEVGVLQEPELPTRLERLLRQFGLPIRLPSSVNAAMLADAMQRDKKVAGGQLHWVLPVRAGEVIVSPDISFDYVNRVLTSLGG